MWRLATALAVSLCLPGALACQERVDKAGNATLVVRLVTLDTVNDNGQSYGPESFVRALEELSGGGLEVEVDESTFTSAEPDAEADIVRAIAAGEADGGWPATRAFAAAGLEGLEVLEAPLALTSYDAVREVLRTDLDDRLLERLDGTGVKALGLAIGPLRRPFAADHPLLEPDDWEGQRFRSYGSPVQDSTIRALGGEPVHVTHDWADHVRSDDLRGVELDVAQYQLNAQTATPHLTSNVVLWPKVYVLALHQGWYDDLSEEQRGWVDAAAERAVATSLYADYDEEPPTIAVCDNMGVRLHRATAAQLRALRSAVEPVHAELAADPLLAEVLRIAEAHPGTEELPLHLCAEAPTVDPRALPDLPRDAPSLPQGVYRVTITQEDVEAARAGEVATNSTGTWTLTVEDGRFQLDCVRHDGSTGIDCNHAETLWPDFDSNPRLVGPLWGGDDVAYFEHRAEDEQALTDCTTPPSDVRTDACMFDTVNAARWELDGDELRFSDLRGVVPFIELVIKPWRRID